MSLRRQAILICWESSDIQGPWISTNLWILEVLEAGCLAEGFTKPLWTSPDISAHRRTSQPANSRPAHLKLGSLDVGSQDLGLDPCSLQSSKPRGPGRICMIGSLIDWMLDAETSHARA